MFSKYLLYARACVFTVVSVGVRVCVCVCVPDEPTSVGFFWRCEFGRYTVKQNTATEVQRARLLYLFIFLADTPEKNNFSYMYK